VHLFPSKLGGARELLQKLQDPIDSTELGREDGHPGEYAEVENNKTMRNLFLLLYTVFQCSLGRNVKQLWLF